MNDETRKRLEEQIGWRLGSEKEATLAAAQIGGTAIIDISEAIQLGRDIRAALAEIDRLSVYLDNANAENRDLRTLLAGAKEGLREAVDGNQELKRMVAELRDLVERLRPGAALAEIDRLRAERDAILNWLIVESYTSDPKWSVRLPDGLVDWYYTREQAAGAILRAAGLEPEGETDGQ